MAMELKQEVNSDPRKRFHLLRRLKKATKYADQLLMLSEACERCDARTRLEAQVTTACVVYHQYTPSKRNVLWHFRVLHSCHM